MQVAPGGCGRVFLWVVLLLVTCTIADWTDDYSSSSTYTQYSTFQAANGSRLPISGGGNMDASAVMAWAWGGRSGDKAQASALEAVFGAPLGAVPGASADTSPGRGASARGWLESPSSNGMERGTSNYGWGPSNQRSGSGLSGSGAGWSGSSGSGASTSIFAGPQ